jgi:hypothetical protein
MKPRRLLFTVATLGLVGFACSSGTNSSADGGDRFQYPRCVSELIGGCSQSGTCVYASVTDRGLANMICFESGVRAARTSAPHPDGCVDPIDVVSVTGANGSPCYSFESGSGTACVAESFVWKDPFGQVVATGTFDPQKVPSFSVTCARTDETASCGDGPAGKYPACCGLTDLGGRYCGDTDTSSCTSGSCP